ncbi:MAG: YezD family protein [Candidatus Omnitrophica bacterium]|nr:YezD family protein [Candidatus Omnitrophota bacterium]
MSNKFNSKKIINDSIIKDISGAVEKLGYGTVVVTVHNKKITQVEVAEKQRFDDIWKVEEGGGI